LTKKSKNTNIILLVFSAIVAIIATSIAGIKKNSDTSYIGFPFDWIVIHPNNSYSFPLMGLIVNIIIFYFLIKVTIFISKKLLLNKN